MKTFGAAFDNSSVADSPYYPLAETTSLITTIYAHKRTYPLRGTPKLEKFTEECVYICTWMSYVHISMMEVDNLWHSALLG